MQVNAYAKLNLSLDILEKEDNFHNLTSVMQKIDLHDTLRFEPSDDIIIQSQFKDEIILTTIEKVQTLYGLDQGIEVHVEKNIPVAAGLGGGSSDAAATLIALNQLWNLNMSKEQLIKIGAALGSDVPFFLAGNSCLVEGKGEKVKEIALPPLNLLLVSPGYKLSTKEAYQELDKVTYKKRFSSNKMKESKTVAEVASILHNDFIHIQKNDVKEIIHELKTLGAMNASITGKGPTVFGIFEDEENAQAAFEKIKNKYEFIYITKSIT